MTKSHGPMTATGTTPFESRTVILVSLKRPNTKGVPERKHLRTAVVSAKKSVCRVREQKGTHERFSDSPEGRSTRSPGSCLSHVTCWYVGPTPV